MNKEIIIKEELLTAEDYIDFLIEPICYRGCYDLQTEEITEFTFTVNYM